MTPRLPIAIAVVALAGVGLVSPTFTAKAEDTMPKTTQAVSSEEQKPPEISSEDRAAFLDARIAALHAGLELTPDQAKLWPAVESAVRDFCKLVETQREKFIEAHHPMDMLARLQMRSENLIARGEAMKKIADAAAPLYDKLTDVQKHRLRILVHAVFHPFGWHRFGMMHGMMGRGMMGWGRMHGCEMGPGMGWGRMHGGMMGHGMMGHGMMGNGMMDHGMMDEDEEQ